MGENLSYYIRKIESMVSNYPEGLSDFEITLRLSCSISQWDKIKSMLKQDPNLEYNKITKIWKPVKKELTEDEQIRLK